MKRFNELTKGQQDQAIGYARRKAVELIRDGVVLADRQITPGLLSEFSEAMAEDAWYSERDDQVIADIADGK